MHVALTIAGSDSGGGAGVQADLKTFAAHQVYGVCAITAVTAQNTIGITAVHAVPADVVVAQIEALVRDIRVDAAKTGMLANRTIVEAVADCFRRFALPSLVVDPVLWSSPGTPLLAEDAVDALKRELLPCATCVTPNRAEAELLAGCTIASVADARDAARRIVDLGTAAVVVTGGHLPTDNVVDILYDGYDMAEFAGPRVGGAPTHGTGCTFSAGVAAALAQGHSLGQAVQTAKSYVCEAIRRGIAIGAGSRVAGH